jgi:hypothetical protein
MYAWSDDTSDWYGAAAYSFGEGGKDAREEAARRAAAAGPRAYGAHHSPNPAIVDPRKRIRTGSKNPIVVAVDVTGSMATWPFEIFDRLPLLYNTLSQYREDLEICFAAIGDAGVDRWPLQVTEFAHGYDLEQQLNALYGEGGGGDAPESYGLFAWWVEHHVEAPDAKKPFLIVFGDAPMHRTIPKGQIERLLGETAPEEGHSTWKGKLSSILSGSGSETFDALEAWKRVAKNWDVWFLRRPTGRKGDEVDRQWASAIGEDRVFRIDDEQRAVDYAMGLVARSWGRFGDFQENMRARQEEAKVKSVAERIRADGPRVLACPACGGKIPPAAVGRTTCSFCGSTLEL